MPLPDDLASSIDPARCAFVQIDMQRRHVDPNVGYHLIDAEQNAAVVAAAVRALSLARRTGIPLVHVATYARRESPWGFSDMQSPFWKYQTGKLVPGMNKPRQMGRNTEGSLFAEIPPELAPQRNEPLVIKKRYSGFYQTDLELVLRGLGAEILFVWGVNTNNCVLATVFDAFSRDFLCIVIADACGSMNGAAYHDAALRQIEAALGFVITCDELEALFRIKMALEAAS